MESTYTLEGFSKGLNLRSVRFQHRLPGTLVCSLCGLLSPRSMKFPCSHNFCKKCYKSIINSNDTEHCPFDQVEFHAKEIYQDNAAIWDHTVYCSNRTGGCSAVMPLLGLEKHLQQCNYFEVHCQRCSKQLPRQLLLDHVRNDSGCVEVATTKLPKVVNVNSLILDTVHKKELVFQDRMNGINELLDYHAEHVVKRLEASFQTQISSLKEYFVGMSEEAAATGVTDEQGDGYARQRLQELPLEPPSDVGAVAVCDLKEIKQAVSRIENSLSKTIFHLQVKSITTYTQEALKTGFYTHRSPAFLVGECGYRVSILVEFRKSLPEEILTHVSLGIYMVIEKGPHDDSLQWPYQKKTSIQLVNHANSVYNRTIVLDTLFHTVEAATSLCKPAEVRNRGIGYSRILTIPELMAGGFVRDDSIFLKFMTSGI